MGCPPLLELLSFSVPLYVLRQNRGLKETFSNFEQDIRLSYYSVRLSATLRQGCLSETATQHGRCVRAVASLYKYISRSN